MRNWSPSAKVKQIINDWWPNRGEDLVKKAWSNPDGFLCTMAALQADLIRHYLSSMDNETGKRAIKNLRWLDRRASGLE
jgi:hypothetical protein